MAESLPTDEKDALDAILVALWQCETEAGYEHMRAKVERHVRKRMAQAWDERDRAKSQYLGPDGGHDWECMGWEDCYCASYPNPYRVLPPGSTAGSST